MLNSEEKKYMKENRLKVYEQRIYSLEMDIAAFKAVGEEKSVEVAQEQIDGLRKSIEAIGDM